MFLDAFLELSAQYSPKPMVFKFSACWPKFELKYSINPLIQTLLTKVIYNYSENLFFVFTFMQLYVFFLFDMKTEDEISFYSYIFFLVWYCYKRDTPLLYCSSKPQQFFHRSPFNPWGSISTTLKITGLNEHTQTSYS